MRDSMPTVSTLVNRWQNRGMTVTTNADPGASAVLSDESCCSQVTGGVLSVREAEQLAHVLKAVADPTRLRLLSMVAAHDGGEACVCDLTGPVGLSQGTVSHHMKVLVDAGLLTRDQRGRWAYYSLVPGALDTLAGTIAHPSR